MASFARISLPTFNLKEVSLADTVGLLGTPLWVVGSHPGCRLLRLQ